eukprot:scaffold17679_cov98-Isochrysis_galbana.AAC.4
MLEQLTGLDTPRRQPKVCQLCVEVGVEQHVGRLEVAMHHPERVAMLDSGGHLRGVARRLLGRQCAPALDERVEIARLSELQDEEHVILGADHLVQPHHVRVPHRLEDADLSLDGAPIRFGGHLSPAEILDRHAGARQPVHPDLDGGVRALAKHPPEGVHSRRAADTFLRREASSDADGGGCTTAGGADGGGSGSGRAAEAQRWGCGDGWCMGGGGALVVAAEAAAAWRGKWGDISGPVSRDAMEAEAGRALGAQAEP